MVSPVAFAITAISPGFVNCFAKTAAELYTGATKISFNVSQAAKGHVLLFLEKTASIDGELRGNSYPSGMKSLQGHSSPTHLLFSSNFTLESLFQSMDMSGLPRITFAVWEILKANIGKQFTHF